LLTAVNIYTTGEGAKKTERSSDGSNKLILGMQSRFLKRGTRQELLLRCEATVTAFASNGCSCHGHGGADSGGGGGGESPEWRVKVEWTPNFTRAG
jgi:hypothetical protein